MKTATRSPLLIFVMLLILCCPLSAADIVNLRTEYSETPLGIDVENPRFSWQMASDERGSCQKAYRVTVSDEAGNKVWDSGKVRDGGSLNIKYEGTRLLPSTRYEWQVKVWDNRNKSHMVGSWFETGLMNPDVSAWSGARWIGGGDEDMVLFARYLPVFRISYSVKMDERSGSTKAGFIYGANDPRLSDKNKNLYQLENGIDGSYLKVGLDIAPLSEGGNARLDIYRAGYHPDDDPDTSLRSFSIPGNIINEGNKYDAHKIHISSSLGYTHIYIDGTESADLVAVMNLNPLGRGGDFIAFPVVSEIGFSVPTGHAAYFSDLEVLNYRSPSNVVFSEKPDALDHNGIFAGRGDKVTVVDGAYFVDGRESGAFIVSDPSRNSMPMLRTTFDVSSGNISRARLYVTARGIYDFYINGERIGDDYFNPGLTQYNKTHMYQTFDVTGNIRRGDNAMGAVLAEGWWSGGATFMGEFWNFFGNRQSLLAKLVITYLDGTEDVIVTDPRSWKYINDSPVVYGSFFQGEVYDASKEALVEGWSTARFDDSGWKDAVEVGLEGSISHDGMNAVHNMPPVDDYGSFGLIGQFGETAKKIKELTAVSVEEVRPGVFVYDMGQNMVGVPKISLSGIEPGRRITLRFAEVKYPALPEYETMSGMIMLENIRAAMAQDIYIAKGGDEEINPRFTFHGYRFVEITGIDSPLPPEAVKGVVISSVHGLSSSYETSDRKINKLWENITWSMSGNFLSIPTDCPQRNERLGWSGDISVFSRTAGYMANMPQFLRKHMRAMRDTQREDGRFPDVAPLGGGFGGILWGSAGITVAWESYQQFGDRDLLEEHYEPMKRYIEYILEKNIDPETNILVQENPGAWGNLGDWLSPEDSYNDKTLLWEAYFIYDLELMSKIAAVLGRDEDAGKFRELLSARKSFFNETYLDPDTGDTVHSGFIRSKAGASIGTQASYVLPLAFGIIPDDMKDKVVDNFIAIIARDGKDGYPAYSLLTGFIGTASMCKALSDNGRSDVAYKLFRQTSYPSWLYSVEQGATTVWERLNSYTHTDGFGGNNRMNSFNHYSFGAVGAWMYNYSLGIERDESSPGFKHFVLQPSPDHSGGMAYAKGYYESMYGRIESGWEINGDACDYSFTLPANTSATLYLDAQSPDNVTENGKPLSSVKEARYIGERDGKQIFELQSGKYNVRVE